MPPLNLFPDTHARAKLYSFWHSQKYIIVHELSLNSSLRHTACFHADILKFDGAERVGWLLSLGTCEDGMRCMMVAPD